MTTANCCPPVNAARLCGSPSYIIKVSLSNNNRHDNNTNVNKDLFNVHLVKFTDMRSMRGPALINFTLRCSLAEGDTWVTFTVVSWISFKGRPPYVDVPVQTVKHRLHDGGIGPAIPKCCMFWLMGTLPRWNVSKTPRFVGFNVFLSAPSSSMTSLQAVTALHALSWYHPLIQFVGQSACAVCTLLLLHVSAHTQVWSGSAVPGQQRDRCCWMASLLLTTKSKSAPLVWSCVVAHKSWGDLF